MATSVKQMSPACFKNSLRCVKLVVISPPFVSVLNVPYAQRFPPVVPAGPFRLLGSGQTRLRSRSLIIVALMGGSEPPKV